MGKKNKSTGCEGLDEILRGGFREGSSNLIVGGPGAGKTVLALQCLAAASRRGEKCLYITFAEPTEQLRANAGVLGWSLEDVVFEDLTAFSASEMEDGEYSVFPPSDVEREPVWSRIYRAIEKNAPDWVVIDSATFLAYLSTDEYQYRKQAQRLVNHLSRRGCISLLLFEQSTLEHDASLALAVDCVISIQNGVSASSVVEVRTLNVRKQRGSGFLSGHHAVRIGSGGMTVFPRRIERMKTHPFHRTEIASGVAELDELLEGGLTSGTTTLITGPSGVGKSTLGTQFMITAARNNTSGVIYTFEEGTSSYLARCNSLGMGLEDQLESRRIRIREINPLEMYPDEFLQLIRSDVEQDETALIMIDSLRGYNLAMAEYGNLVANMQNLLTYALSRRASVLLINELEFLTGDARITDIGVSYLCDNVLLLRYAEYHGELIKVISCLKKRLGGFQPELRQLRITAGGVRVGEKLNYLSGLLTGVPSGEREGPVPAVTSEGGSE